MISGIWIYSVWALMQREVVRFFRQRTRIIGAIGQPLIFWLLFGSGLKATFQPPEWAPADLTYQQYFLPGVLVLIVMFTAIFATITLIEDRKEGFLQGVLASPIPRSAIVMGKVCGGTALSLIQVGLFLIMIPIVQMLGWSPQLIATNGPLDWIAVVGMICLLSFSLTALGYALAWPMDSTQGFHAIMSVLLMPMWLLSGAFFPMPEDGVLAWLMTVNPLTYGMAVMQRLTLSGIESGAHTGLPSLTGGLFVTGMATIIYLVLGIYFTRQSSVRNAK